VQVLSDIKKLLRLDALNAKISVVQSVGDLPPGVRQSVNVDAKTQGFVYQGKAYLVADNIAPGKARSVFLHEVGAHLPAYADSWVDIADYATCAQPTCARALFLIKKSASPDSSRPDKNPALQPPAQALSPRALSA